MKAANHKMTEQQIEDPLQDIWSNMIGAYTNPGRLSVGLISVFPGSGRATAPTMLQR